MTDNTVIDAEWADVTPSNLPAVIIKRPLPTEITNARINAATLPTVVMNARNAIAKCTDLSQLLRYRDRAEAIAAAVRTMKEVGPQMVRDANKMMADAWRKGGELLSQYSSIPIATNKKGKLGFSNFKPSPRTEVARKLGLKEEETRAMVRVYKAPLQKVHQVVQKTSSLKVAADRLPTTDRYRGGAVTYSDDLRNVSTALTRMLTNAKIVDAGVLKRLTPDERKVVKAKITEIMELLDEMDRLCK